MIQNPKHPHPSRRAFSLIEVLLAVFILAIGLIMVASVFPVGADWTRQATEDSLSQNIALNALSVIQDNYATNSLNSTTAGKFSTITTTTLQALPSFTAIPISERTYQYGNSSPFPAHNPLACNFYWTALARITPGQPASATKSYDLYIFIFRKGEASQTFFAQPPLVATPFNPDPGYTEITGDRDNADPLFPPYAQYYHYQEPTLVSGLYVAGTYAAASNSFTTPPVPPVGFTAVGANSGTVFRQNVDFINSKAIARPGLATGEPIIYAPPADGTNTSPLVYIYQTTVSF